MLKKHFIKRKIMSCTWSPQSKSRVVFVDRDLKRIVWREHSINAVFSNGDQKWLFETLEFYAHYEFLHSPKVAPGVFLAHIEFGNKGMHTNAFAVRADLACGSSTGGDYTPLDILLVYDPRHSEHLQGTFLRNTALNMIHDNRLTIEAWSDMPLLTNAIFPTDEFIENEIIPWSGYEQNYAINALMFKTLQKATWPPLYS